MFGCWCSILSTGKEQGCGQETEEGVDQRSSSQVPSHIFGPAARAFKGFEHFSTLGQSLNNIIQLTNLGPKTLSRTFALDPADICDQRMVQQPRT